MEFTAKDCKDMYWSNIASIDVLACDVLKTFPSLSQWTDFAVFYYDNNKSEIGMSNGQLISLIAFVYDKNSPYAKKYLDINRRKRVVLDHLGLERKQKSRFNDKVEDVLSCKNNLVNDAIMQFLRLQQDSHWQSLVSYLELKAQVEKNIIDPKLELKDKKDSLAMSSKLRVEIDGLQQEFLLGEKNDALINNLYDTIQEEQMLSPEYIAEQTFNGQTIKEYDPHDNPLPIDIYMKLRLAGKSVYPWDNEDLILKAKRERFKDVKYNEQD